MQKKVPPGPTLEALLAVKKKLTGHLFYLVTEKDEPKRVARWRERGLELLGRANDELTFFGVPIEHDAPTVDERPIAIVDKVDDDPPEVVAKNLADFLSLVAYSPAAWGETAAEWKECEKDSLEAHGKDVLRLRGILTKLPGVKLPREPWKLQRGLPKVAFVPRKGSRAASAEARKALAARVAEVFESSIAPFGLVLLFDEVVEAERGKLVVRITADVPESLVDVLPGHALLRAPLQKFLDDVRRTFPEQKFELEITFENLSSENGEDGWRRFEIAMKHARKLDVLRELRAENQS